MTLTSDKIDFLKRTTNNLFMYSPKTPDQYDSPEDMADDLISSWVHPDWVTEEDLNLLRRSLINLAKGW